MAIRLILLNEKYFRWFDSGDLQNLEMLNDINKVAELTPNIQYWLPTQERKILKEYGAVAPNLNIRVSSTKVNSKQNGSLGYTNSFVTDTVPIDVHACPSSKQSGKCLDCRACWDKDVKTVAYMKH